MRSAKSNENSIEKLSLFLQKQQGGIDITIHAAGILHEENIKPEKSITQCTATNLKRLFEVNSIGPLMVAGGTAIGHPKRPSTSLSKHWPTNVA